MSLLDQVRKPKPKPQPEWQHPASEAERLTELEGFLARDFETFPEVRIEWRYLLDTAAYGRVDLLAVPKSEEFDVALAFEVKSEGFDLERSLKQSADYVGARVLDGPYKGYRIAACFLYPANRHQYPLRHDHGYCTGMLNLIAQWRVGQAYIKSRTKTIITDNPDPGRLWTATEDASELILAIGFEVIWSGDRGWHTTPANRMLSGKRTIGGKRREV